MAEPRATLHGADLGMQKFADGTITMSKDADILPTVAEFQVLGAQMVDRSHMPALEREGMIQTSESVDGLFASGPAAGVDGLQFDSGLTWLFDLNLEAVVDDNASIRPTQSDTRVLREADGRLNRQAKAAGRKTGGAAMFAVPFRRALLYNPVPKRKAQACKKSVVDASHEAQSVKMASGNGNANHQPLSLNDQATALLMRSSGLLGENEAPIELTSTTFRKQFVSPLQEKTVGGLRGTFGLADENGSDSLNALVVPNDI